MKTDNSTSGFVSPEELNVSDAFSDQMEIPSQGHSLLVKAKRLGRWWLLKGLKTEYRDQTVYRIFLRKEFELLSGLQHSCIVQAVDFKDVAGVGPCIVMEWIDGVTLKEWLHESHTKAELRAVARQLMDALAYVHSRQTVHRDLKPSNIMVMRSGAQVKLIDFGLSDTDSHIILKQPAGTEGYVSDAQKQQWQTDVRNDIYSLGCVLREMHLGQLYDTVVHRCLKPAH